MSVKKIRIGFIGAGQIANQHMETYKNMSDVIMVAVCDVVSEKALEAQKKYGFERTYTDAREMLEKEDLDAVDVCVHNNKHMPLTVMALEAGKNVYCEKPMAGTYIDAKKMLDVANKTGKKLAVQLAFIYTNESRAAKKLIDDGQLGKLYHAKSTGFRRRGRPYVDGYGNPAFVRKDISAGGALYDMGVYHISQMLYLLGNPTPTRISGKTYQELDIDAKRKEISGFDVEELGLGFVRFGNDLTMDIIESWAIQMGEFEGSSLSGSKGGLRLRPFEFYRSIADINFKCVSDLDAAAFRWEHINGESDYYSSAQRHWICALQGKVELIPSAEIALNTMLISQGIYMSNQLNREVTVEEILQHSASTALVGENIFKDDDTLREESLNKK